MAAKIPWDLEAERSLWASICAPNGLLDEAEKPYTHEDALYWFLKVAWGAEWYLRESDNKYWISDEVHKPYLRWLQKQIMDWKTARRAGHSERWQIAIIIPRGFGKTVTATKAANLWTHLDEPNMTSMIGSEVQPKAKGFLKPIKEVLQGTNPYAWFSWLYGKWYTPERDWTNEAIVHGYRRATGLTEPSIGTFGVERGITGEHPLAVWWDDPLSQTKLKSEDGGKWLETVLDAFDATYPAHLPHGLLAMVLTRYLDNDVAGTYLQKEGIYSWDGMPPVDDRIKPDPKGKWRVYFLQSRDTMNNGKPVLPVVWSDEELTRREITNPVFYSAQLMNDPGSGEHMPLTREQIEQIYINRDNIGPNIPIEYATIHLDTAFKKPERRKRGDYNVISVLLHDLRPNGILYFDNAKVDNTWRVEDFLRELVNTMKALRSRGIRVRAITDELVGDKARAWPLLMQQAIEGSGLRMPEFIELNRSGKQKDMRIRNAAGYWVEGFMRLPVPYVDGKPRPDGVSGLTALIHQMLRIGVTKYDDVSDAVSDGYNETYWRKPIFNEGVNADEGQYPMQPGDYALKSFSKRLTNDEARMLYDEQHPHLAPQFDEFTNWN